MSYLIDTNVISEVRKKRPIVDLISVGWRWMVGRPYLESTEINHGPRGSEKIYTDHAWERESIIHCSDLDAEVFNVHRAERYGLDRLGVDELEAPHPANAM